MAEKTKKGRGEEKKAKEKSSKQRKFTGASIEMSFLGADSDSLIYYICPF